MQCPACLNEVDPQSAFCNRCGASVMQPAGAVPVGATVPPGGAYSAPPGMTSAGLSENAASAIAYLTIIPAIIFLVIEPYNRIPLVRFHSWQSIGLAVAAIVLQIIVAICETLLHFIPGVFLVFSLVHLAIALGLFLVWLFAILKASKGEWFKIPVIGDFAEKQARTNFSTGV
jgi:uncharacterized membrane protein